eukprot:357877-Chlamydomonas_euryale.AAC.7
MQLLLETDQQAALDAYWEAVTQCDVPERSADAQRLLEVGCIEQGEVGRGGMGRGEGERLAGAAHVRGGGKNVRAGVALVWR